VDEYSNDSKRIRVNQVTVKPPVRLQLPQKEKEEEDEFKLPKRGLTMSSRNKLQDTSGTGAMTPAQSNSSNNFKKPNKFSAFVQSEMFDSSESEFLNLKDAVADPIQYFEGYVFKK
jgi:hypothetical protein